MLHVHKNQWFYGRDFGCSVDPIYGPTHNYMIGQCVMRRKLNVL